MKYTEITMNTERKSNVLNNKTITYALITKV